MPRPTHLSPAQSTLLRLVAQASQGPGDTWLPRVRGEWLREEWAGGQGARLDIHGAGVAAAFKALCKRGWVKPSTLAPYAAQITPAGFAQAEVERGRPVQWAER